VLQGNNTYTPSITASTTFYAQARHPAGCTPAPRTPVAATINPAPTITLVGGNNQTPMQGSTMGSIVFKTTNATSATITSGSLPAGLTASWSSPNYTISGTVNTDATAKAYTFTVTPSNQCSNPSAIAGITVKSKVNTPTYAASTKTWTYGTVTVSDMIKLSLGPCTEKSELPTSGETPAFVVKNNLYYYNWYCIQIIKNTACHDPWRLPAPYYLLVDQKLGDESEVREQLGRSGTVWGSAPPTSSYGYFAIDEEYDRDNYWFAVLKDIVSATYMNKRRGSVVRCVLF
jgi:hypothetical protein